MLNTTLKAQAAPRLLFARPAAAPRLLHKRRTWYDGDPTPPGDGKGAPTPQPAPTPPPAPDLEAIKQEAVSALLKDLGVADAEALKKVMADAKAAADAQKTDLQKAQEAAEQARKDAEKYKADLEAAQAQRRVDQRNTAIENAARAAKADIPGDVVVWAERHAADALKATLKADGTIDDAAVKALIEKCQKERKAWFAPATGNPGSPSNRGGSTPDANADKLNKVLGDKKIVRL